MPLGSHGLTGTGSIRSRLPTCTFPQSPTAAVSRTPRLGHWPWSPATSRHGVTPRRHARFAFLLGDGVACDECVSVCVRVCVAVSERERVAVGVADGDTANCDGVHDGDASVESEADGESVAWGVADTVPVGSSL